MKTSVSAVKRIGQSFVIEGTLNGKISSGRPRASTMKDDYRLKITVLKENFCWPQKTFYQIFFDKNPISFALLGLDNLEKEFMFAVLNKKFLIPIKSVILSLWLCFIVEALGRPELIFLFNVPSITKLSPIFSLSIFSEICKITKNLSPPMFFKIGTSNFQEIFLK